MSSLFARASLPRIAAWFFVLLLMAATGNASAATYTWDSDGIDTNGITDGSGSGVFWSTSSSDWFLNTSTADIGWTNNTTDIAAFGGTGSTGGTVTMSGSFSAGGILFNGADTGSYTIAGTGSPTLTLGASGINVQSGAGAETLNNTLAITLGAAQSWTNNSSNLLTVGSAINSGANLLTIAGTGNTTVSGAISGTGGLTMSGSGTLTLSAASVYGATSVSRGTLKLDFTAAGAPTSNIVGSASAVTMSNGGFILVQGKASTANTQTFASTNLNAQAAAYSITANAGSGGTTLLALGALSMASSGNGNLGGYVDFVLPAGTQNATNGITASGIQITNGIFTAGSGATGNNYATVNNGADWAALLNSSTGLVTGNVSGASGNIVPLPAGSYTAATTTNFNSSSNNMLITASVSPTSSPATFSTLKFSGGTSGSPLLLTLPAATNVIQDGGILVPSGSFATIAATSTGTLSDNSAVNNAIFNQFMIVNNGTLSISAPLVNGSAGTTTLVNAGAGTTTYSGANTYTGTTFVNQGNFVLGSTGSMVSALIVNGVNTTATINGTSTGTGATSVNQGTFLLSNTGSLVSALAVNGANSTATINGAWTATTAAVGNITVTNGGTINSSGTVAIGGASGAAILVGGTGGGTFNITGGTFNTNYSGGTGWGIGNAGPGSLNVSAGSLSIANGNVFYVGFSNASGNGTLTVSGTGLVTLGTPNVGTGNNIVFGQGSSSGTINLNGGTLNSARNFITTGGTSVFNFNGGKLQAGFTSTSFLSGLTTANVRNNTSTIDTNGFDITIGQSLSHSAIAGDNATDGGLIKIGAGTLTLSTAGSYNGGTTLTAGTVSPGADTALGSGAITFNGGTLSVNGRTLANNLVANASTTSSVVIGTSNAAFNGSMTGTGTVNFSSTATAQVVPTMPNVSAFGGTIGIDTSNTSFFPALTSGAGAVWNITGGATGGFLFTNDSNATISLGELTGNGRIGSQFAAGTTTWSVGALNVDSTFSGKILNNSLSGAAGVAALAKVGTGTLTLSGPNTYSGGTTVSAGTLALSGSGTLGGASGALALGGGMLDLGGLSATVGTVTITAAAASGNTIQNGNLTGSSYTASNSTGNTLITANLLGSGGFTQSGAGTSTLSGANTFTGATTASLGTLNINSGNTGSSTSNFIVQGSGTAINITGATVTGGLSAGIGYGATGTGTSTATVGSGGILNLGSTAAGNNGNLNSGFVFVGGGPSGGTAGNGILTVNNGGTVNVAAAGTFPNDEIYLAGFGGSGVVNLNAGGLLSTARAISNGGTSTFNFNGGMLRAGISNTGFLGVTNAYVQAGGGTIDTQANNITIGQALLHDPGLGATADGGLIKLGSGTLSLSAASTFTGGMTITAGGVTATANSTPTSGAVTSGPLGAGAIVFNGGTLTLNNAVSLANNLSANASTTSNVVFVGAGSSASGALNGSLTGTGTVNFSSTSTSQIVPLLPNVSAFAGTIGIDTSGNFFFPAVPVSGGAGAKWSVTGGTAGFLYTNAANATISLGELSGNGRVGSNSATKTTWSIGALNTNSTFSGVILNNNLSGATGPAAVAKVGSGVLTLTGPNTYTGGTTVTSGVLSFANGSLGSSGAITMNGGTLQWNGTNAQDISSRLAMVNGTTATFDTQSNPVVLATAFGSNSSGALTKVGSGVLSLGGANTYTGATTVSGGTLRLSGSAGVNTSSGIAINGATAALVQNSSLASTPSITLTQGTLDGTGTVGPVTVGDGTGGILTNGAGGAGPLTIGSLTFNGVGTITANVSAPSSAAAIAVTNSLTTGALSKLITVNASNSLWTSGNTYNLISYGSLAGAGLPDFTKGTIANLGGRQNATLATSPTGLISLLITGDNPIWTGAQDGRWTTSTVGGNSNWKLQTAGTPTDFQTGDAVLFDDTATGTTSLNISDASVSTTSVIFNNSTLNYALAASDPSYGISAGLLIKNGSGTLTIGTANSYSGGTTLNAGTLRINNAAALGATASTFTIAGGMIDNTSGGAITLTNNNPMNWNADITFLGTNNLNLGAGAVTMNASRLVFVNAGNLTVGGGISGTGFSLTKTGAGTLTLQGVSTYNGGTFVNAGTLALSGPGALNSGSAVTMQGGTFDLGGLSTTVGALSVTTAAASGNTIQNGSLTGSSYAVSNTAGNAIITANLLVNGSIGLTKSGSGTATLSGANTYTGATVVNAGTLTLSSGGSLVSAITVDGASSIATINGTWTANTAAVGNIATTNGGTLNFNGTATVGGASAAAIYVGDTGGGTFNVTGGTLTTNYSNGDGWAIGNRGPGSLNISAGALTIANNNVFYVGFNSAAGAGTLTISGAGLLTMGSPNSTNYTFGHNGSSGTINLNGGTLSSARNILTNGGTSVFNFNGGTLQAGFSSTGFLTGLTTANVRNGGATIDTNGFNITIPQTLLHSTVGGDNASDGGLTKIGSGTLTLTAANTLTGATTVNAGTLLLSGSGSINSSSAIAINGPTARLVQTSSTAVTPAITVTQGMLDGTTTVGAVTVGDGTGGIVTNGNGSSSPLTIGSLTFNGVGAMTANVSAQGAAGVAVTGALTTGSTGTQLITVNASNSTWTNGSTYDLISYGSLAGAGFSDFTLGTITNLGGRQTATLTNPTGFIAISISGDTSIWTGAQNGNWTTNTIGGSSNWKLQSTGAATDFQTGDVVLFDDTAPGATAVSISTASVSTSSVTFNNSTKNYTVSSSGGFGISSGALIKNGSGTVTINTANTYSAGTTINAGTLQVGNNSALGTGAVTLSGGTLALNGQTLANNLVSAPSTASSIVFAGNSSGTFNGSLTGSGTVNLSTTATIEIVPPLPNTSGFTGTINVDTSPAGNIFFPAVNGGAAGAKWVVNGGGTGTGNNSGSFLFTNATSATISLGELDGNGRIGSNNTTTTTWSIGALNTDSTFSGTILNNYFGTVGFAAITKVGTGTLTLSGSSAYSGPTNVTNGTLTITGSLVSPGAFTVTGATSVANINGAYTNTSGGNVTASNGGIVNFNGNVMIGTGNTGAIYAASGGAINVTGGTVLVNYANNGFGIGNASAGALNVSGGTLTVTSPDVFYPGFASASGNGTVTVSGTGAIAMGADTVQFGNGGSSGTLNIGVGPIGGSITTGAITTTGGTSKVNFNGGTLRAGQNNSAFMQGLSAANVRNGGAIIDTNGFNVGIGQSLVHSTIGGDNAIDGGLTKVGAGSLTLSATNSYTGPTTISGGTLRLASSPSLPSGLQVMPLGDSITNGTGDNSSTLAGYREGLYNLLAPVASGVTLVGSATTIPGGLPTAQQHHEGHGGYRIDQINTNLDGSDNSAGGNNGGYWFTGGNGTGRNPLTPDIILLHIGTNDILQNYQMANVQSRLDSLVSKIVTEEPNAKLIVADIVPIVSGTDSTVVSYNQMVNAVVAKYVGLGDHVTLADMHTNFPSNGMSVDTVHPNATGYNWMADQWYSAILADYPSGGSSAAIPSTSAVSIASGATLDLPGVAATVGPLSGAGAVTLDTTAALTINSTTGNDSTFSGTISGPGSFVKAGPATLTLSGNNSYSGGTVLSAGTLRVANASGSATGSGPVVLNGGTLTSGSVGFITGPVSVGSGFNTIAPGGIGAIGTLTLGSTVSLNGNSTLTFDINGASADMLSIGGILSVTSGPASINFSAVSPTMLSYTLATFASNSPPLTTNDFHVTGLPSGYTFVVDSTDIKITSGPPLASGTWTNGVGDYKWTTQNNWQTGQPSGTSYVATFDTTLFPGTNSSAVALGVAGQTVGGVVFNSTSGGYTIGAGGSDGTLTLDNTGGTGPATVTVSTGSHTIVAPVAIPNGATLNTAADPSLGVYALTISGAISGNGGLTKTGSGTLRLASINSYSGGTTVNGGTLRTTANNALGSGPLVANAAVSLGGNESIGTLSGSSAGNINVASGNTLSATQATDLNFDGSLSLGTTGSGATLALSNTNSHKLTLTGSTTLNTGIALAVNGGTLNFNLANASTPVVSSGVTATVAAGATLELSGAVSALSDPTALSTGTDNHPSQRVAVQNDGTLQVDGGTAMVQATQQVGGIDPYQGTTGSVVLSDYSSLTADHINQMSLVIGNGSVFTLAPSDMNGNPMDAVGGGQSAVGSSFVLAGSLTPSSSLVAPGGSLLAAASTSSAPSVSLGGVSGASISAVPEPSTIVLLLLASIGVLPIVRRSRR